MQETFETSLPVEFIQAKNNALLRNVLNALFDPAQPPYTFLVSALTDEVRDKFGSPEISNIQFELKSFDVALLKGRVRINYDLRLTFSCSAIVNDLNNQHSYWNFTVDKAAGKIHFVGDEYGDLRSTANEF